jgi:tRNA threonylcarbamoyladenosine biosynthesis protein TsaB
LNILALDTSTEACSVGMLRDDGEVFSIFEIAPRQHTKLLPQMLNTVLSHSQLSKSDITHCAFANGPGAFTGIRIAASTAQGIAMALDIPIASISSLAVLAQVSFDKYAVPNVLVALDARMSEVYWAVYESDTLGLAVLKGCENLNKLADVYLQDIPAAGTGHGWAVGEDIWRQKFLGAQEITLDSALLPNSTALLKLAQRAIGNGAVVSAECVSINYLRNNVAEKSKKNPLARG